MRRTRFNSTALIRLLSELTVADVADSTQSFAEKLAQWLDWTDAISLSVALSGSAAQAAPGRPAAEQAVARVRGDLVQSMGDQSGISADGAIDYLPYRHHYMARQRAMESSIGPLRAEVRAALAGQSPRAGRLAVLDAVMDDVLRAREHNLLARVPSLLEKHFDRLRQAGAAGWLAAYCKDMQAVLLAELELRLQPVEGLLEALRHQATPRLQ